MFYFGWYERVDRLTLYRFHIVAEVARSRREFPALVCAYLLAPDFRGYESGASSRSYRDAIRHADFQISRVLKDLRAAGLLDELHIALVSDHGMVDVETHFVLDDFLRCNLGFKLPGRQLWESTAFEDRLAYYRDFDCVTYGSGDRYWAICLRKPLSGPDGPGMADWPVRPGAADLRDYPTPSGRKDLPALLASREEIALVAFRGPAGEIHVQNGAGVVAFAQPAGPGGPIAYRVVQGRDPLGYHAALGETPGPEGIEKTSRQWLKASAGTDYPDLPAQILAYFRARRSGDLCVLAAPGYDFRDEHRGGHGGMLPGEVFVPLLVAGPGIPAGRRVELGRSVDIFPTILDCMGRAIPEELDGRSLLNLDR
jgi:arylsulfatase A-like enzyme